MKMLALALALPALANVPAHAQSVDHAVLAERFLESVGRAGTPRGDLELEDLLTQDFAHVQAGLFDVYWPLSTVGEKSVDKELQRVVSSLLAAQARWVEWVDPEGEVSEAVEAEVEALQDWVKSWKPKKWDISDGGSRDVLDLSGAEDELRAASAAFADRMGRGAVLGLDREPAREPVVLLPARDQFVEAIAFAGWLREDLESEFWRPNTHTWTNFYLDDYKFLAMDYASPGAGPDAYDESMDMSARTPTGLEQQVVQLSMNSLIDNYYGDKVPPTFAGGLAVNLVVDLFDECNTRADGDLSERRTEAVEIFVPGGNPSGGSLGTIGADSRWRDGHGEDRFVKVLQKAQKSGAKEMKAKKDLRYFELQDEAGKEKKVFTAPFLGAEASKRDPLPSAFEGDQLEFLRAYRCAFLWWLRNESLGKESASQEAFATFLKRVAQLDSAAEIEQVFAECFEGAPLSTSDLDRKDDLEGRFLFWLSRK